MAKWFRSPYNTTFRSLTDPNLWYAETTCKYFGKCFTMNVSEVKMTPDSSLWLSLESSLSYNIYINDAKLNIRTSDPGVVPRCLLRVQENDGVISYIKATKHIRSNHKNSCNPDTQYSFVFCVKKYIKDMVCFRHFFAIFVQLTTKAVLLSH